MVEQDRASGRYDLGPLVLDLGLLALARRDPVRLIGSALAADMTGAEIKAKAEVPPTYQLFLEEEGDTADRAISDAEGVDLEGRIKHFFAVPPATFGNQ